jgi:SNF2 family DNA or RNA helicase
MGKQAPAKKCTVDNVKLNRKRGLEGSNSFFSSSSSSSSFKKSQACVVDLLDDGDDATFDSGIKSFESSHRIQAGTLVVCPMTLMSQWVEEIESKTKPGISVLMYYGANRQADLLSISLVDIVVTSYGVLVSESQQHESHSSLLNFHWHRVILDEAHTIKNPATEAAKACVAVTAERRWALTGTPIQNSLNDMQSLIQYLHHEPWCEVRWWRKTISEPYANGTERFHLIKFTLASSYCCKFVYLI